MTSDDRQNVPAVPPVPQSEVLEMPVAEFEGEYVRLMLGKLPGVTLPMDYGYARGTHLKLELEVRVRRVSVDELNSNSRDLGAMKGDLFRLHDFALVEARIVGAYTADQLDPGVGGGLAATGHDIEDEETDDRPVHDSAEAMFEHLEKEEESDERRAADIPDF